MAVSEVSPEVQEAYDDLLASFASFMECFGKANEAGIDAGAAVAQHLRSVLPPEAWEELPLPVKMMLG